MAKIKEEVLNIASFIKKYKISLLLIFVFTILTYGIKLFAYHISIDTEVIINNYHGQIQAWNSIGRYSLGMLKTIFSLHPFQYYISNFIMVIVLSFSTFFLYYILSSIKKVKTNNLKIMLFGFLIISSPILAEQFNFTLQCAEVAISFFIFDVGLFFFLKGIQFKKNYLFIFSILCFIETIGCYQSFVVLIIAMGVFILLALNEKEYHWKDNLQYICKFCAVLIISLIGYFVVSKMINYIFHIESTSYLTSQIGWLSNPITSSLYHIFGHIFLVLIGYGIFYSLSYFLACFTTLNNIIKNKKNIFYCFLSLLLLAAPFCLSILLASTEVVRSQFALPIIVATIIIFLGNWKHKTVLTIVNVSIVLIIISQFIITTSLFYSGYRQYREDVNFADQIITSLENDYSRDKTIIFVGSKENKPYLRGETIGASFFNWDIDGIIGANYRIHGFMKTLGYSYIIPNPENYTEATERASSLGIWPATNSVLIEADQIIIKLSD